MITERDKIKRIIDQNYRRVKSALSKLLLISGSGKKTITLCAAL